MNKILQCTFCESKNFSLLFNYDKPPLKEIIYNKEILDVYNRQILACSVCGHCYSIHKMNLGELYEGNYNSSTYNNIEGMHNTFNKILALDEAKSDNTHRCIKIDEFITSYTGLNDKSKISTLDIGSGLGVFPWKFAQLGFNVTAFDPDPQAVKHIKDYLKIPVICGDYLKDKVEGLFSLITLNKVLEHVEDPIEMLNKTKDNLAKDGVVYVELPDGEVAAGHGADREEFTIDHIHIFSFSSLSQLILKAGYEAIEISRIQEPSTKFTLRAFIRRK